MPHAKVTTGLLLLLVVVSSIVFGSCRSVKPQSSAGPSRLAPDFTLTDISGKAVTLSALKGKVVLIDLWATWCPPCRASLPHTQALSESADAKSGKLVVLGVNQGEDAETVQAFTRKNGYSFRVVLDPSSQLMKKFQTTGIPTFVIIDREGNIAWKQIGFDERGLHKALTDVLAK